MKELVTIIFNGAMGVVTVHGKLLEVGIRPYAQFEKGVYVKYIPKGKRKPVGFIKGFRPYLVVLKGHVDVNADVLETITDNAAVKVQKYKYASYDTRWVTEFDEKLNNLNNKVEVLFDFRWTQQKDMVW